MPTSALIKLRNRFAGLLRHKISRIQRANVPHCSNRNSYEAQQRLVRRIEWGEMPWFDVWKWMIWGSSQTMMQSMSIWAIKAISLWVYGVSGCWEQFAQLLHGCVLDSEKISKIHDKKDYILEFSHHHCWNHHFPTAKAQEIQRFWLPPGLLALWRLFLSGAEWGSMASGAVTCLGVI